MKEKLFNALVAHFQAHIMKHCVNIEVMMNNPIGIPEHTDIMDAIEKELELISEYEDKLAVLQKYFKG